MFQKRVSAYSVMSEVIAPAAITAQTSQAVPAASAAPASSAPARKSPTLPRKPENGGMPPRFRAGMKNRIARSGDALSSPARRLIDVAPPNRSMSPVVRNRVVCTVMWCTT